MRVSIFGFEWVGDLFRICLNKLFGLKIKIEQLPNTQEIKQLPETIDDKSLGSIMQRADLKDLLLKTGREVVLTSVLEAENKKRELLNSPELPKYFTNILKSLAITVIDKSGNEAVLIGPSDIKCDKKDYDLIVEFFKQACDDAGFDWKITKKVHEYYFIEPASKIKAAFQKMQEYDQVPQLSMGGPYR